MKTFCNYYNQNICASCTQIQVPYKDQLQKKVDKLSTLLAFAPDNLMLSPVSSTETHFRNKAKFSITGTIEQPLIGLVGEEDLDQGRDIKDCPLHHPKINQFINVFADFIKQANLRPYQIKLKSGELKGIIVYFSSESQELYVRLILRSKESLDRIKKHLEGFLFNFPQIKCFSANIQPIAHAILEGEEEIFFTQTHFISHQIGPVTMKLHPQGFVQTNQEVALKLYSTAAEWVKELKAETFMELYSGQGAFSFFVQKHVKKAIGIEINPEAVERANSTAQEMNLSHLKFKAMDAAKVNLEVNEFSPQIILVNPPRRGLGQAIEVLAKAKCDYFIYSSCNAETLAQDLITLQNHFKILKTQLFDMFPHTQHFETLVLLKSINADKKE